jgi:hypothetical protein
LRNSLKTSFSSKSHLFHQNLIIFILNSSKIHTLFILTSSLMHFRCKRKQFLRKYRGNGYFMRANVSIWCSKNVEFLSFWSESSWKLWTIFQCGFLLHLLYNSSQASIQHFQIKTAKCPFLYQVEQILTSLIVELKSFWAKSISSNYHQTLCHLFYSYLLFE